MQVTVFHSFKYCTSHAIWLIVEVCYFSRRPVQSVFRSWCNPWCTYVDLDSPFWVASPHHVFRLRTCGHAYCAQCIIHELRVQLMKNLAKFSHQRRIYPHLTLPDTQRELQERISCIRWHGGIVSQVFSYLCPICRQVTNEHPVQCYGFEGILQTACNILDLSNEGMDTSHDNSMHPTHSDCDCFAWMLQIETQEQQLELATVGTWDLVQTT
jgi:hypothetical protein